MAKIKNFDQVADKIREAYEDSMRNTSMRFVVCLDGESGEAYTFEDVAGGNSEPERVWSGADAVICEFCHQFWSPSDGDEMYVENLLSYTDLSEEQKSEIIVKEGDGDLAISEIEDMYPDALDAYNDEYISNEMAEFDPDEYIEEFCGR